MYDYNAEILKFVDGDTVHVQFSHGLDSYSNDSLRFYGINCPEISTPEGKAAAQFTRDWLFANGVLVPRTDLLGAIYQTLHIRVETIKDHREKYGRYLAILHRVNPTVATTETLNDALIRTGNAVPYFV